jgi:hypothetical protein
MRSGRDAALYGAELRRIMRFLGISDGNMQVGEGSCEVLFDCCSSMHWTWFECTQHIHAYDMWYGCIVFLIVVLSLMGGCTESRQAGKQAGRQGEV